METAYYILNHYFSFAHWLSLLIVFIAILIIWKLVAKTSFTQAALIALFVTYIFFILLITLIAKTPAVNPDGMHMHNIKLVPFWSWYGVIVNHSTSIAVEIGLNVVLFVPVGVLMRRLGVKMSRVAFICCCFSLCIELTQYFTCRGLCEVFDDVIGNTSGAVIGWIACGYVRRISRCE